MSGLGEAGGVLPNAAVFEHGLFPPLHGMAISPSHIRRLVDVLPPTVEVAKWQQVTHDVLGIDGPLAALLFDHFQVLRGSVGNAHASSRQLALFMLLQTYQQTVVRSPVKSQEEIGDTWPRMVELRSATQVLSARTLAVQTRSGRRATELARERLQWITRHMDTVCDILVGCVGVNPRRQHLGAADVEELTILLEPPGRGAQSLSSCLSFKPEEGPSPPGAVGQKLAAELHRARLASPVPVQGSATPGTVHGHTEDPGHGLAIVTEEDDGSEAVEAPLPHAVERGTAEADMEVSGTVVNISGISRRTLLINEATLGLGSTADHDFHLVDCHGAFIYVLLPARCAVARGMRACAPCPSPADERPTLARSVLVLGCTNCTIVIGAASRVATLEHSEKVRLHATATALRVTNCIQCTLHLCVAMPPLLSGENHRLFFAPFVTWYGRLGSDMATAGIDHRAESNQWASFVALSSPSDAVPSTTAMPLPPGRFLPFTIPFEVPGSTRDALCGLPHEYQQVRPAAEGRPDWGCGSSVTSRITCRLSMKRESAWPISRWTWRALPARQR